MSTDVPEAENIETTPAAPLLRIVKGDPSPAQLAALVAVVAAKASAGGGSDAPAPRSEWGHPARLHRQPFRVGPGAWRASSW